MATLLGVSYSNFDHTSPYSIQVPRNIAAYLPNVNDVRSGIVFGDFPLYTGALAVPAIADVRKGTIYDDPDTPLTGILNTGGESWG